MITSVPRRSAVVNVTRSRVTTTERRGTLLTLAMVVMLPLVSACDQPHDDPFGVRFGEAEKENPFRDRDRHATTLVQSFGDVDFGATIVNDVVDELAIDDDLPPKTIEFESPLPLPKPDQVRANYSGNTDSVVQRLEEMASKLKEISKTVTAIKRDQLTEATLRKVIKEEFEVVVKWRDEQGKLSSSSMPIDSSGIGSVELPAGAVVTSMGGVPVEQWSVQAPVIESFRVASSHSHGGSSGTVSAPQFPQVSAPMEFAPYEMEPVQASYYEAPGQFVGRVQEFPQSTQVQVQVDQGWMDQVEEIPIPVPDPMFRDVGSSECYTNENGNRVCPVDQPTSQPAVRRPGPLGRVFRGRRN